MLDLYANYRERETRLNARTLEQRSHADALRRMDRMERKVSAIRGRLNLGPAKKAA